MRFKLSKESVKQLRGIVSNEASEFVQEQAEEVISFESNPMEYILNKYPSLTDTLDDLLTNYFRDYVTGIFVIAPKPTTFKVLLHNGQMFFLTYGPKSWIAKVAGKRYYLLNLNEEESAIEAIARLLELGRPPGAEGPDETTSGESSNKEEKPAEEEGGEEAASGGEEEAGMTESVNKKLIKLILEASSLSVKTLMKPSRSGGDRGEIFLNKILNKEPFKLLSGEEVVFDPKNNKELVNALKNKKYAIFLTTKLVDTKGNTYSLSKLEKTKDFGGTGTGSGTRIEVEALAGLQQQLDELGPVNVRVGKKIYKNIVSGYKVPGTPKADLALKDESGKPVIFISHKDCCKAKNFQQYGGVAKDFSTNPEVISFAKAVKNKIKKANQTEMLRGGGFRRKVKDQDLALKSIYGLDFGGPFNENNVQILMQGNLRLEKVKDGLYDLKSAHDIFNPTIPGEGYTPYLMATYREGRNDLGIKNCRLGVYPIDTRPTTEEI
jgi:hypothetical protein